MSSIRTKTLAAFLAASSLALGAAHAAPGDFHGRGHREAGPMMQLRSLGLSQAQRDQLFKIFYDQMPAMREQMKQLRQARTELTQAATGERYDEQAVRAAAEAQGRAVTQLALLRAQSMQKVNGVLTPEQRAKLKERMERHGHFRGPR